ncbi:hypothetical protein CRUP_001812 [Coryphaenoides rupestris]|nr:hypothetical protein CRUP_001812 [Coryphaenoides rupestris]
MISVGGTILFLNVGRLWTFSCRLCCCLRSEEDGVAEFSGNRGASESGRQQLAPTTGHPFAFDDGVQRPIMFHCSATTTVVTRSLGPSPPPSPPPSYVSLGRQQQKQHTALGYARDAALAGDLGIPGDLRRAAGLPHPPPPPLLLVAAGGRGCSFPLGRGGRALTSQTRNR